MKILKRFLIMTALTVITTPVALAANEHKHEAHDDHDHATEKNEKHEEHGHDEHNHDNKNSAQADHADHDNHEGHEHKAKESHHGGIVGIANNFHHELLLGEKGKVSLYVEGLPKSANDLKLVTARLIILQGKERRELEMKLVEGDHHRFEGILESALTASDKVVALIVLDDKNTRMVRFEMPTKKFAKKPAEKTTEKTVKE